MSQHQLYPEPPRGDSRDTIDIVADVSWDGTWRPANPHRKVLDSYSIEPKQLDKVKRAAIQLGRSKADLIREGLDLVLEKYRDKLGDLLDPESPNGVVKPENGPSSP